METLRVGDPLDKSTDIGAIVADVQLERIRALVEQGQAEGATSAGSRKARCPRTGSSSRRRWSPASRRPRSSPQEEIFGPVLVSMTFRTPDEAVALANNTRYGLAASVWSENINVTLDAAARVKAGVVWVNSTNLFDAAAGFGGYRESGFGREGGREGLYEYLVAGMARRAARPETVRPAASSPPRRPRTAQRRGGDAGHRPHGKALYRRQAGAARFRLQLQPSATPTGELVGQAGLGNRKDIRNAVEAAAKAERLGRRHGAQSRAGALLHRREPSSPRRRVRGAAAHA